MPFLILFLHVFAFSAFYGNQSEVKWKSAETKHFFVHYPVEYRTQAQEATTFAESLYDTLAMRYKIKLPSKVNLVFDNALFSNGEASPVFNKFHIWLTDWDFKVRGSHSWLKNVITHEFSHLISMQDGSKTPFPWISALQISKSDFYNEKNNFSFSTYIPFMIQPFWFAEGTAQYESYRMGFDSWDTHRDMLLRTAFLNNKVLPLEFMEDFSGNSLEAELGPYTQGFDLVRYIVEEYGDDAIPELWKEMGKLSNITLSDVLKKKFNISEKELYNNWKKNRKEHYNKFRDSLGNINAGEKITKDAFYNDFLVLIDSNLYGLSNFGGDFFDGSIFEIKDSLLDTLKEAIIPAVFDKFKPEKPFLSQGMSIKKTQDNLQLAYVTYKNRDKTGKPYFDIAVADTNGKNTIITKFADAVYPDISADGKQIAFARREANGTRFYLSVANIDEPNNYVDVVVPKGREFNIYNPKFSPDGKQIVFTFFDGKEKKIGIKQINADGYMVFGSSNSRDPSWSLDGKSIYFSGDETGVFNIYKINLQTKDVKKITNVLGGAFSPVVSKDALYYLCYDKDGFSVCKINNAEFKESDIDGIEWKIRNEESSEQLNAEEYNETISFANSEHNYFSIPKMPLLAPIFSLDDRPADYGAINEGKMLFKIGLAFGLNDALNKNFFQVAALQQIGKFGEDSESDLFAGLENRSFPFTINLAFMRANTPSKDTVRYENPRDYEDSLGVSEYASELYNALASVSYSIFKKGDSLTVFTSYDWQAFNLYEDYLKWDYHKRLQAGLIAGLTISDSLLNLQGMYSFSNSNLFRPGTFAESFTVSESGAIKPNYRNFILHEWSAGLNISLSNPIQKYAKLELSLFGSGILNWNSADSDTLDNFYLHPLVIEGYPILENSESYFKQGTGVVLAEARYKFPIYNDFRKRFWIFTTKNFNVQPFVQMGSAWNNHPLPVLKHRENWLRSFGIDWHLENSLFYSVPFNFYFGIARGLDYPKSTRIKIGVNSY